MEEKLIGKVSHFYGKPSVGMIELSDVLKVGDTVRIKGKNLDFTQKITSMRIEFTDVTEASAGALIGVKVDQKVHKDDEVYKVVD